MIQNKELSGNIFWPDNIREKDITFALNSAKQSSTVGLLNFCRNFDLVVQAGGCIGLFPMALAEHFKRVVTFEANPNLYPILTRNIASKPLYLERVTSSKYGLSDKFGKRPFLFKKDYSCSKFDSSGDTYIDVIKIDDLNLDRCDAIQLDIEGHELYALMGAENTIRKYKPVIQLEQNKAYRNKIKQDPCFLYLDSLKLNYRYVCKFGKDVIYVSR